MRGRFQVGALGAAFVMAGCTAGAPAGLDHVCDGVTFAATSGEMAKSPRDDLMAEWLALQIGDRAVASDEDYERVRGDLDAVLRIFR